MTQTEVAKFFRTKLREMGIEARCRCTPGTRNSIQVFVTHPDLKFDDAEQRAIRTLAITKNLTRVRRMSIDPDRMTDPQEMTFYLP